MSSIKYVKGDLFQNLKSDRTIFIPHVCNTLGVMGSGFVVPLKKNFPGVDTNYSEYCGKEKDKSLGYVDYFYPPYDIVVCNMIAQQGVINRNNPKPIKYAALVKCMESVANRILLYAKHEIRTCRFGSQLAGGSWPFIEELIWEIWISQGIDVTIFVLDQRNKVTMFGKTVIGVK